MNVARQLLKEGEIRWTEPTFRKKLHKRLGKNLDEAAEHLVAVIKRDLSKPQPPSQPFEPPHMRSGDLRDSITYDKPSKLVRRIRVGKPKSLHYAKYLEFGTVKMAPRPFLRPAHYRERNRTAKIIKRGLH